MKTKTTGKLKSKQSGEANERLSIKSILLATDFSDNANHAVWAARSIARQFGACVHLLHVIDFPVPFAEPAAYVSVKELQSDARTRLDDMVRETFDEWISTEVHIKEGRSYREICETAEKLGSDLVVIGTRGLSRFKQLLLGSTAERVVRQAPCSVLVVPAQSQVPPDESFKPSHILVPVDFSKCSLDAFAFANKLAAAFESKILAVHVLPDHSDINGIVPLPLAVLAQDLKKLGKKRFEKLVKEQKPGHLKIATVLCRGHAATEIVQMAPARECDLIVIGTHGRTGWNRVLLGSTTEEVVRHAKCPVWIVRKI